MSRAIKLPKTSLKTLMLVSALSLKMVNEQNANAHKQQETHIIDSIFTTK